MDSDFRSSPSDSAEGRGIARRAWDAYAARVEPAIRPAAENFAAKWTADMLGFYMAWHLYGGFEGLQEGLGMHPSTIWRKVAKFRRLFGVHPDEAEFAGVKIDREAFWNNGASAKLTAEVED